MKIAPITSVPLAVQKAIDQIWNNKKPSNHDNICYTYGDTCYTNSSTMSRDLERHEMTHTKQQGENPDAWWERCATDPIFRYEQELEAYRVQYKYVYASKGKIVGFEYAQFFARSMSSYMYGDMCTFERALGDIIKVLHETKK